jgi:hypothetical protein
MSGIRGRVVDLVAKLAEEPAQLVEAAVYLADDGGAGRCVRQPISGSLLPVDLTRPEAARNRPQVI